MNWIFILGFPAIVGVGDIKFTPMTEAQCRATLEWFSASIRTGRVAATCVGPGGETIKWEPEKK